MHAKQQNFTIWYFVAALLILFVIQALVLAPHVENLSYANSSLSWRRRRSATS